MKAVQAWAEEHWAGVALLVSITGAISLAAMLIVLFGVLTAR